MANIKISELNELTAKDNSDLLPIVDVSGSETKKIQVSNLLDKNIELLAVTDTAPSTCSTGDKYYNTSTKKIYTATGTNTWGTTGADPISGILYIVYADQASYSWDGTDLVSVGGGKEDIVIDDEEPTDPDVKLWIDTGAVQNSGKEVNIGSSIDSKVGLNVLVSRNLFDMSTVDTSSRNSLTFTISGQTLVVNGTCSGTMIWQVRKIPLYANTTYYLKGGSAQMQLSLRTSDGGTVYASDDGSGASYTPTTNFNAYIFFRVGSGTTLSNYNFKPMISVENVTYEPYITPSIYANEIEVYKKDNLETYSTQEQRIGTWINGKPIYRRVYTSSVTGGTSKTIANITLDTLVKCYGTFKISGTDGATVDLIYYSNSNDRGHFWYTTSHELKYSNAQSGTATVIVEYTKTTD